MSLKPGDRVPLQINRMTITTDTTILPDWKPAYVRYELYDSVGNRVYFVDKQVNSLSKQDIGWLKGHTEWHVTDTAGHMEIPAFAKEGEWKLKATFHDEGHFIFGQNTKTYTLRTIKVYEGDTINSLQG